MIAIEAQYAGVCFACEGSIRIGELITPDPLDGAAETWMHARCPADPPPRPVCTSCFMEIAISGACGCPT